MWTPVGRLIMNMAFTKDADTGLPLIDEKTQEPYTQYVTKIAIPKDSPDWPAFEAALLEAAKAGVYGTKKPLLTLPGGRANFKAEFSWKVGEDANFPDCWIVRAQSRLGSPKCYKDRLEVAAEHIKLGYWVTLNVVLKPNNSGKQPGVYVTANAMSFMAFGEEIIIESAPNFDELPGLPPGVSATAAPANTMAPPKKDATPPPPPKGKKDITKVMADGCPYTYQQLVDAGYSDEDMRAEGFLV